MDKKQAIEIIKKAKSDISDFPFANSLDGYTRLKYAHIVPYSVVISTIESLYLPKPILPRFVAYWLIHAKETLHSLGRGLNLNEVDRANYGRWDKDGEKLLTWMSSKENEETFANAWMNGYTIETRKLYTVELYNPNGPSSYTFLGKGTKGVLIMMSGDPEWKKDPYNHLTEEEIKKDFPWAWEYREEVK